MKLFIKNKSGQKVTLGPNVSTRSELLEKIGRSTFTLDSSDYLYSIDNVVAETSKDTSVGWALLLAVMSVLITGEFMIPLLVSALVYLMGKIFHKIDQKRTDKFNASKIWPE